MSRDAWTPSVVSVQGTAAGPPLPTVVVAGIGTVLAVLLSAMSVALLGPAVRDGLGSRLDSTGSMTSTPGSDLVAEVPGSSASSDSIRADSIQSDVTQQPDVVPTQTPTSSPPSTTIVVSAELGAGAGAVAAGDGVAGQARGADRPSEVVPSEVVQRELARIGQQPWPELTFGFDESELSAAARARLDEVALILGQHPEVAVEVGAYTDSGGTPDHNKQLSTARAEAVAGYLVGLGLDPATLRTFGFGEERPVQDNETLAGRKANRRVELVVPP